jgi:hypothetical protein
MWLIQRRQVPVRWLSRCVRCFIIPPPTFPGVSPAARHRQYCRGCVDGRMLFYCRSAALWPVVLGHYLTDFVDFAL